MSHSSSKPQCDNCRRKGAVYHASDTDGGAIYWDARTDVDAITESFSSISLTNEEGSFSSGLSLFVYFLFVLQGFTRMFPGDSYVHVPSPPAKVTSKPPKQPSSVTSSLGSISSVGTLSVSVSRRPAFRPDQVSSNTPQSSAHPARPRSPTASPPRAPRPSSVRSQHSIDANNRRENQPLPSHVNPGCVLSRSHAATSAGIATPSSDPQRSYHLNTRQTSGVVLGWYGGFLVRCMATKYLIIGLALVHAPKAWLVPP